MKKLFLFLFVFLISINLSYSQSFDKIQKEAYPNENFIDNSDYAKLWKEVLNARNSGDEVLYQKLTKQLVQLYPNKFVKSEQPFVSQIIQGNVNTLPPFKDEQIDWGAGDVRITNNLVADGTPGNPRANYRTIRLRGDTLGNLYSGMISGSRDTLYVYKSTNGGLNWNTLTFYYVTGGSKFHSFDAFITDSLGFFRIGAAVSVTPSATSYAGTLYYISFNTDGSNARVSVMRTPIDGKGFVGPAIVSDGFFWAPSVTYWYTAYQQVDTSTGVTNVALINMSTNWGYSWITDTARSTYNDYELDVDYNHWAASGVDTIYVLMTNNLTATNENLRLRYVPLSGIGTATTWKQYNPASTSDNEFMGTLAINRQDTSIGVMFTKTVGGIDNIYYTYASTGSVPWVEGVALTTGTNNAKFSSMQCQEKQGAYRVSYISTGSAYDTVKYTSTFTFASGFATFTTVNVNNSASTLKAPDVIGRQASSASYNGGVLFAGATRALWYDGSNLTPTGIHNTELPVNYILAQNYPNPFNPSTTINFEIPKAEFVTLKVYDVLGKEVTTIINGIMQAGKHQTVFDASKLSSGIYFYKLTTNNFSDVKKMMLIK